MPEAEGLTAVPCGKSDEIASTTTAATAGADGTTADGEATTTAPEVDPYEPEQENFGDANGSNPVSMRAEIAIPVYEAIARISWTSSSPK